MDIVATLKNQLHQKYVIIFAVDIQSPRYRDLMVKKIRKMYAEVKIA